MARTRYIWDPVNDTYLMEKDAAGNTTAVYTNEPGPYGPLISQRRGGQTNYYHFDGQGSTRQLTDTNQNVTDSATYTAFGETVAQSGATANPFGYKGALGYYVNTQSRYLYVRARSIETSLARWFSLDPDAASISEDTNQYRYVRNRPTFLVDPRGENAEGDDIPAIVPLCEYCGCCVKGLRIPPESIRELNSIPGIPGPVCGMEFVVEVDTEYLQYYDVDAPFHVIGCNLEWWERLDLPQPGQRTHQWYNQFVEMNASPTFAGWHNRREPCPGTFTARITDMPSLSGQNATGRQNIFIAIKVSGFSAGSCQPKDYVAYVHVNLQIVRGNCIRRRVNVLNGLPGFVGQPPGW